MDLMALMQQMMGGGGGGHKWQPQMQQMMGGGGGGDENVNWKGELQTAYLKSREKGIPSQGDIKYMMLENEGQNFKAEVTVAGKTFKGDSVPGKKKAEQSAAKRALKVMFKNHDVSNAYAMSFSPLVGTKGTKRKHEVYSNNLEQPAKSRLAHTIQLLLQRTTTKEDIVYSMQEAEGHSRAEGQFVATVTINALGNTFTGEPQPSKKAAENSAAEAALAALKDQTEELETAHQEKKKQKNKEVLSILKAKDKEKKAEKQAEAKEAALK